MKNWIKSHKLEVILFSCALVIRLCLFVFNFNAHNYELIPTIIGDDGYYELSQNLMNGNGFSFDVTPPFRPNPLRPPVWPFLISFFAKVFGTYWAVFVFEIIIGSLIPVLGMHVARRIVGDKLSKWVGFALAFEPYSILLSFVLYTETSFTFFFLVFLIFFFRYLESNTIRNAIWSGMFLGIACMIKPTVQFFPILIPAALAILWRKKLLKEHLKHAVLFIGCFCLVITPWLYRNHQEFGVWGISAQPAFNLYVYLVPTVLAIDNHTNFRTEYEAFVKKDNFDENGINLSNSPFYKAEALKVIREHKFALAKSMLLSGITFFTHDGMLTILGYGGVKIENVITKPVIYLLAHPSELFATIFHYAKSPALFVLIFRLIWIAISVLFIWGAWLLLRKKDWNVFVLAAFLMILYFAATTCINGLGVNARFRVPINVFIFSFAIYAFFDIKRRIQSR